MHLWSEFQDDPSQQTAPGSSFLPPIHSEARFMTQDSRVSTRKALHPGSMSQRQRPVMDAIPYDQVARSSSLVLSESFLPVSPGKTGHTLAGSSASVPLHPVSPDHRRYIAMGQERSVDLQAALKNADEARRVFENVAADAHGGSMCSPSSDGAIPPPSLEDATESVLGRAVGAEKDIYWG